MVKCPELRQARAEERERIARELERIARELDEQVPPVSIDRIGAHAMRHAYRRAARIARGGGGHG